MIRTIIMLDAIAANAVFINNSKTLLGVYEIEISWVLLYAFYVLA